MAYRKRVTRTADERIDLSQIPFGEAMYLMTPELLRSSHLGELVEVFERIDRGERCQVVVTVPPRFGKSETICHGLAWLLLRHPMLAAVYATYSQKLSDKMSRKIRNHVEPNGFEFSPDYNRVDGWQNISGGGLQSTGVQGPFTGMGVSLAVLDDPIKDRADAESVQVREMTWDWITDVLFRGCEADASVLVVQTRWHIDDPSGKLLAGKSDRFKNWQHIHLRPIIIDENGEERSIWPERWPLEELQAIRGDGTSRTWTSLYMGDPQPDGALMFGDPVFGEMPGVAA